VNLEDALGLRLGGEVVDLVRLSGGASRETWAFDLAGPDIGRRPLILQRRRSADGPSGHPPEVEAALLAAAAEQGVPVPGLVGVGDDDGLGAPWLVVDRLEGETIPRKLLRDDAFAEARPLMAAQCGRALAAIHSIPVDAVSGLDDQDQVENYAALIAALDHPRPVLELGLRRLQATRPAGARRTVVHGDFRTGNLLVGPDGLRAVLDWELAHIGDPVEDLGWFCMRAWRFGSPLRAGGFGPVEELLAAYEAVSGVAVDLDELRWWEAFAALKWAVICLLQAGVHLSGASRSVELAAIGRRACESEWDLLRVLDVEPLPDDPPPDPAPVEQPFGRPTAAELVEAVREFLSDDVMARTEGRLKFHARVATNALSIVERELALGPAVAVAHAARLASLGYADDADLVAAIRAGKCDSEWATLAPDLAASTRDHLLVANPKYL
jgi:aminoglycoside phosphotransferase (APT) family kinase protein